MEPFISRFVGKGPLTSISGEAGFGMILEWAGMGKNALKEGRARQKNAFASHERPLAE